MDVFFVCLSILLAFASSGCWTVAIFANNKFLWNSIAAGLSGATMFLFGCTALAFLFAVLSL